MERCVATDKKAMTVYVDADLYERIEANADADNRSVSNYVERLLREKVLGEPQRKTYSAAETSQAQDLQDAIASMAKRRSSKPSGPAKGK